MYLIQQTKMTGFYALKTTTTPWPRSLMPQTERVSHTVDMLSTTTTGHTLPILMDILSLPLASCVK